LIAWVDIERTVAELGAAKLAATESRIAELAARRTEIAEMLRRLDHDLAAPKMRA
jgi:hypothetical protein